MEFVFGLFSGFFAMSVFHFILFSRMRAKLQESYQELIAEAKKMVRDAQDLAAKAQCDIEYARNLIDVLRKQINNGE